MYFFRNLFIQLSVFLKILSYLCILLVVSSASAISFDNSNYSLIYNPNSFCQGPDESLIVSDLITGVYLIRYSNVIPLHINESFRLPAASILNEKSLFIADYRNNRIVEVNLENGEPKDVWVHPLMQDPEGITVDRNENFYIASYGNGKILKFNKSGELLSEWNGTSEFPLIHPHGIFYHNESIYVTELAGNPKIIKFDSYGNIQQIFGDGGILKYPTSVWVSDDGIFVSDAVDHNIKIFYHNGNLNKTIGSFGSGSGEFFYPYGVGLSGSGEIYVADTHNQRIQIFSQDGEFISIMSPHCIIEKYDKKTNFHEEKLPYKITQNTGEYGSKTETETILLSQKNGTLSVFNQSNFKQITTGLIYPYEFLANKNGYYILDEPGSIQIIDQNGTVITNIALTNIQFDPTNPINSWVYRPHSFDFIQNGLIIANSVPGTISFLSNYGDLVASLTPSTDLTNCSVRHIPASIKCINDTHCIIVDIGSNEIIQLNTSGYQAEKLYFPIPIDYPSKVITSKDNPLVAIIEKLKNRVYFYDSSDNTYLGFISNKTVPELNEPISGTFTNDSELFLLCKNMSILLDTSSLKDNNGINIQTQPYSFSLASINSTKNDNSLFYSMYQGNGKKGINYWEYYLDSDGIPLYDFSFSFLNFLVPVPAGYGAHQWPSGIAHYGLLNYYSWLENNNDSEKKKFLKVADWFAQNAVIVGDNAYWYFNGTINRDNMRFPLISASSQAGGSAILIKASKFVDTTKAEDYLSIADKALHVLQSEFDDEGLKTNISNNTWFIEYPSIKNELQKYDVQPMIWTLVFLSECGEKGNNLYYEGKKAIDYLFTTPNYVFDDTYFWSDDFLDNKSVSSITSKIMSRFIINSNEVLPHA